MALMKRLVSYTRDFFISFQKDPLNFVLRFKHLEATEIRNENITHKGNGNFILAGGVEKGGYIGQKLLEG